MVYLHIDFALFLVYYITIETKQKQAKQEDMDMTKKDLMNKLEALLAEKKMYKIETFSGKIGWNNNKATIENAIKCLEATDEEMNDYLTVFKLKYPNSYISITNNGNWLTHSHNRYYVYTSAKSILA